MLVAPLVALCVGGRGHSKRKYGHIQEKTQSQTVLPPSEVTFSIKRPMIQTIDL